MSDQNNKPTFFLDIKMVAIVNKAINGDRDAFREIVVQYEGLVKSIAAKILHNYASADDAAQEIFLRVHKNIRSLRDPVLFGFWLRRITVHYCCEIDAKLERRKKQIEKMIDLVGRQQNYDEVSQIEDEEFKKFFQEALRTLTGQQRAALSLQIEGFSCEEIRGVLNISITAVKSVLLRAKEKMREAYRKWEGE